MPHQLELLMVARSLTVPDVDVIGGKLVPKMAAIVGRLVIQVARRGRLSVREGGGSRHVSGDLDGVADLATSARNHVMERVKSSAEIMVLDLVNEGV